MSDGRATTGHAVAERRAAIEAEKEIGQSLSVTIYY
jgi:hypothetical protein